jgi:hypothetical protein
MVDNEDGHTVVRDRDPYRLMKWEEENYFRPIGL